MNINGTTFHDETPAAVAEALERARATGERVRFWLGDPETGEDWGEENDVTGKVGRSTGQVKVPLLLANSRSRGGGAILTQNIIRLQVAGREVYRAANYREAVYTLRHEGPGDLRERVYRDGVNVANFKTQRAALRWIDFMTGKRATK